MATFHALEKKSWAQRTNALFMLLAINGIIFVTIAFIKVFYLVRSPQLDVVESLFNDEVLSLFVLPSSWQLFVHKPWTVLTYMFTHVGLWYMAGCMLWMLFFGYIVQDLTGNRKLFPLYIYGSIVAGAVYVLLFSTVPGIRAYGPQVLFGATAGTMAFMGASLRLAPGYRMFHFIPGGIPLWAVALLYVVMDIASLSANNPLQFMAHIAAAAAGYVFIFLFQKGYDAGSWMNRLYDSMAHLFTSKEREKTPTPTYYYKTTVEPFTKTTILTEQKIDEILDKILEQGVNSLTEDEKNLLKSSGQGDSA